MNRTVYVGKVLDNADPDKSGAIKVQINDIAEAPLDEEDLTSGRYPFAGENEGFYYPPPKNAIVEIELSESDDEGVENLNSRWVGMLYPRDAVPETFSVDPTNRGGIKFGDEVFVQDKEQKLSAIVSENVRLGNELATEPLVLGNKFKTELTTYLGEVSAACAAFTTPANGPAFAAAFKLAVDKLLTELDSMLSSVSKTE